MGDGSPASVVQSHREEFYSPRERADAEECNVNIPPLTLSSVRSLNALSTSSNASFLTVQPHPDFSLPTQEEATISSQDTNKFASQ